MHRKHPLSAIIIFLAGHLSGHGQLVAKMIDHKVKSGFSGKWNYHAFNLPTVLYIEHEGSSYIGCLLFDDAIFCCQLVTLLQRHCNRPFAEIGSLDISHTL